MAVLTSDAASPHHSCDPASVADLGAAAGLAAAPAEQGGPQVAAIADDLAEQLGAAPVQS